MVDGEQDRTCSGLWVSSGEPIAVDTTLVNGSNREMTATLTVQLQRELGRPVPLAPVTVPLKVAERKPMTVPIPTREDEYGYAVHATLTCGEAVMDAASDLPCRASPPRPICRFGAGPAGQR